MSDLTALADRLERAKGLGEAGIATGVSAFQNICWLYRDEIITAIRARMSE